MSDAKAILKNAFIDAQLICTNVIEYSFSDKFKTQMKHIIKYQKGILRLINTTGKRVACIILAIFICFTTVACSIEEVRKPIIEEIKKFYVNAKELLTGTAADDVAGLFPNDVSEIVGTSYISKSKNQYVINNKESITSFIKLLSQTQWGEPQHFEDFDKVNTYWTFDFYNSKKENVFQIKMCNDIHYVKSKIAIISNGKESHFYISNQIYKEILAFTNEKYLLHNSKLEKENKDFFYAQNKKVLHGVEKSKVKKIKTKIRNLHYEIELFLLNEVSNLKEKDSIYWEYVVNELIFDDPISNERRKYDMDRIIKFELNYIISNIEDKDTKEKLSKVLKLWEASVKNRDLEGMFTVHEYLHDFDYYAFNYPTSYVYNEWADYQGLDDYFGHLG